MRAALLAGTAAIAAAGCINNEVAKPEWTYSVCIDICGPGPTGPQAGGNSACGSAAGQCACTLQGDLFCGQCRTAPAARQCVYCPGGTYCSADPCPPSCTQYSQPPPPPQPPNPPPSQLPSGCTVDCGNGRCCSSDYPVCCTDPDYCGTSGTACAAAGKPPPPSSSSSGSSGSGSGGGSGSGSGGGGSCPCQATAAPSYGACTGGDQAACYCAAAWLDECGIQNAAAGCCTANQAGCISGLKSDCQTNVSGAVALASQGASPECTLGQFPSCQ